MKATITDRRALPKMRRAREHRKESENMSSCSGPNGEAQRAVFQLRRKVVNSAKPKPLVNNLLPGERVDFRKVRP